MIFGIAGNVGLISHCRLHSVLSICLVAYKSEMNTHTTLICGLWHPLPILCFDALIVSRLEEKESEMKREYTKLHERYTEVSLDRSHPVVILITCSVLWQQWTTRLYGHALNTCHILYWPHLAEISKATASCLSHFLAICHSCGCTVVSGVVVVGGICNRSQMRTSKCACLIFGVSIGLDPARNAQKEFLKRSKFMVTHDILPTISGWLLVC